MHAMRARARARERARARRATRGCRPRGARGRGRAGVIAVAPTTRMSRRDRGLDLPSWSENGSHCAVQLLQRRSDSVLCYPAGEAIPANVSKGRKFGRFGCLDSQTVWTQGGCAGTFSCNRARGEHATNENYRAAASTICGRSSDRKRLDYVAACGCSTTLHGCVELQQADDRASRAAVGTAMGFTVSNAPLSGPAYTHAVYGEHCAERLKLVAITHWVLQNSGSAAARVVFLGEGCPQVHEARSILRADRTGAALLPLPCTPLNWTAFGVSRPTRQWAKAWLPKVFGILALEHFFAPGARVLHLDADALPTQSVDELFSLSIPPGSCLLASDESPTFQTNSGVLAYEMAPGFSSAIMRTFYAVGTSLGDGDQDLLSFHFRSALALSGRYHTFAHQFEESTRGSRPTLLGRMQVLKHDPTFVRIVHYARGGLNKLDRMCQAQASKEAPDVWASAIMVHCLARQNQSKQSNRSVQQVDAGAVSRPTCKDLRAPGKCAIKQREGQCWAKQRWGGAAPQRLWGCDYTCFRCAIESR